MKKYLNFHKTAAALIAVVLILISSPCIIAADGDAGADILPDAELLAAYIEGSDADELYGMTAVGATILNRIKSGVFTKSLSANASTLGIFPSPSPSDMALYAARLALAGEDPTNGAVHITRIRGEDSRGIIDPDVTLVTCGLAFSR